MESLYQINYPNYDVILVDNNSQNDSIEKIRQYCKGEIPFESKFFKYNPKNKPIKIIEYAREEAKNGGRKEDEIKDLPSNRKLILIKNEKNYGFAEGNNIAMRYALKTLNPKYILLLNNDTVVDKEFLNELVKVAESNENIGIVGPKIYYYNFKGKNNIIWFAGGKINVFMNEIYSWFGAKQEDCEKYNCIKEVEWTTVAALMLKSIITKKISLLNPEYFVGNEDVEYCIKARKQNIKVVYVPRSKIWHKIGRSRPKPTAEDVFANISYSLIFIKNNFSKGIYLYHIMLFFVVTLPILVIRYLLKHRDKKTLYAYILSFKKFILKKLER